MKKHTDNFKSETPEFVLAASIDTQEAIIQGALVEISKNEERVRNAQKKKEAFLAALEVLLKE